MVNGWGLFSNPTYWVVKSRALKCLYLTNQYLQVIKPLVKIKHFSFKKKVELIIYRCLRSGDREAIDAGKHAEKKNSDGEQKMRAILQTWAEAIRHASKWNCNTSSEVWNDGNMIGWNIQKQELLSGIFYLIYLIFHFFSSRKLKNWFVRKLIVWFSSLSKSTIPRIEPVRRKPDLFFNHQF